MRALLLIPLLAVVAIAGCVDQTAVPQPAPPAAPPVAPPPAPAPAPTPPPTTPIYPYETPPGAPTLTILSPTEGQAIAGTAVGFRVEVTNFRLISTGPNVPNRPNEGHLDVKLDDRPVLHTFEKTGSFSDVPRGSHTLRIELVNNDHSPLSPPVVQTVTFSTQ